MVDVRADVLSRPKVRSFCPIEFSFCATEGRTLAENAVRAGLFGLRKGGWVYFLE